MTTDRTSIVASLKRQHLFQGLDDLQLAQVATRFDPIPYPANTIVFPEGAIGDSFYIVQRGKVQITRREGRGERILATMTAGDHFVEEALLFDTLRSATVRVVEPTTLLHLSRDDFFELLEDFPSIRLNLSATVESFRIARREKFKWLEETEIIYLICRKHWFFMIRALIVPLALLIGAIPLFVFSLAETTHSTESLAARVAASLMTLGGFLVGVWQWIDWGNDYYIVTNQRVLWLEKVIAIYESSTESPLDQIQSVMTISSFWGRRFGYGEVNVLTFTGGILMRNMERPQLFTDFVNRFRQSATIRSKEEEMEVIERTLRQEINKRRSPSEAGAPQVSPPSPSGAPPKVATPLSYQPSTLKRIWQNLLAMRYVEGSNITYRKHWLILLNKTGLPALILFALLSGGAALLWRVLSRDSFTPTPLEGVLLVLGALVSVAIFLWWGYYYMDWHNDIYRLTPEQIHDIERKPLGSEEKKTALLDNILSVEHARSGIVQLVFNYGTVTINVGQTKFIFYNVHDPDQVHQDITNYRAALRRRRQAAEAARNDERMVNWLMSFYQESSKLEEAESEEGGESSG